jgi:Ca2+-transporting ATPase
MKRPPRDPKGVLFSAALAGWSLLQGALALLLVSAIYVSSLLLGSSESEVRALTFVSLVLTNIGLIFVNRSFEGSLMSAVRRPNPILWGLIGATAAVLAITLSWPPARLLFKFGPLHADDLLLCLGAGLAVFVASNLVKTVIRRWLPA